MHNNGRDDGTIGNDQPIQHNRLEATGDHNFMTIFQTAKYFCTMAVTTLSDIDILLSHSFKWFTLQA